MGAHFGLTPIKEAPGKKRSGKTRKGNTFLGSILIECAHGAARTRDCQFNGYHKALTVRRGYNRATVATAHKLLRTVYFTTRCDRAARPDANHPSDQLHGK